MSTRKKPKNFVQRLLKRMWRSFNALTKALLNGVLRSLKVNKRRRLRQQSQAGFVLPTVVMVLLVVALLTTAIVIRSFDRAKNASNFRVDQAVLNAATPAIDRAKAKLERLLSPDENRLAGSPPGEGKSSTDQGTISYVLSQAQYTFGDETPLKLVYTNPNPIGDEPAKQTLETAWKFAVDTDNNGKFDTFTLYGIYFRNPPVKSDGTPERARTPLEARAIPQATGEAEACGSGGGAGINGWYPTDGQLKKAFFVYVANVPIGQTDIDKIPTATQSKYESYKGNKGFSALEMQQDQARLSLDNNAVWYDDDLVISNVPTFRLNGRIHTNSNLMTTNGASPIIFYQVSALKSCYYTRENGQISVGGNVLAGDITKSENTTKKLVQVHLYQGTATDPSTNPQYIDDSPANATTASTVKPQDVASNSGAYDKRLNLLVQAALDIHNPDKNAAVTSDTVKNVTRFPAEVKTDFNSKFDSTDPASGRSILTQVLTSYFAKRIRRVSYKEVDFGADPLGGLTRTTVFTNASTIDPPTTWMSQVAPLPPDPNVQLNTSGDSMKLEASNPDKDLGTGTNLAEKLIGDRILVGNALPIRWLTGNSPVAYADEKKPQDIKDINWDSSSGGQRTRISQVEVLDDLGDTSRGGFWEQAAAYSGNAAKNYKELAGGLRIVTGAGIYIDDNEPTLGVGTGKRVSDATAVAESSRRSFLPAPPTAAELQNIAKNDKNGVQLPKEIQSASGADLLKYKVVWPDTMPMYRWDDIDGNGQYTWEKGEVKRGDLQMRATVVYHFAKSPGSAQEPIACIATYYDPSNPDTAQNVKGLTTLTDQKVTDFGTSINGINYPYSSLAGLRASSNNAVLQRQANMIFPDGRWVNKPLKDALEHLKGGVDKLTINDIAAIDAANCALTILYGVQPQANSLVPDGAIQERTFLDARQIKAIHKRDTDKTGAALTRTNGVTTTNIDRQTLLQDITDPAKLKIAELGWLTTEYSLPIEQRQPLEIRVTQIDLKQLRSKKVGVGGGSGVTDNTEYMLPNSGIIYATRDDALIDISDVEFDPTKSEYGNDKGGSATDFKLDPTRRPNGIRIVNGETLARDDSNTNRLAEKGLILASNLPVYIKGPFNLHAEPGTATGTGTPTFREEFSQQLITTPASSSYSNFYTRTGEDKSFACRKDASDCVGKGDQWRPARILADAVTLLSKTFRDGYRSEGDFDLNNNAGNLAVEARLKQGFWWNSFATTADWYDPADGYPDVDKSTGATGKQLSSYLTNGVTPIQRRVNFPEYLMETCPKTPISACGPQDWVIGKDATDQEKRSADIPSGGNLDTALPATAKARAGTTAQQPTGQFVLFPRRVAFKRNEYGALIPDNENGCVPQTDFTLPNPCKAIPIGVGVGGSGIVKEVKYGADPLPASVNNALWYVTTADNANPSAPIDPTISYDKTNKLYYPPYDPETVSERQFLLPAMPEFLPEYPALLALPSVNGTTEFDTPDYAVYSVGSGGQCLLSKAYKETASLTPQACPTSTNAVTGIKNLWERLRIPSLTSILPVISVKDWPTPVSTPPTSLDLDTLLLKAEAQLNIYNLPTSTEVPNAAILSKLEITLDRNGQENPIFVFRTIDKNIGFGELPVEVKLKGVDPNNVFWVSGLGVQIPVTISAAIGTHNRHKLVGNFIGSNDGVFLVSNTSAPGSGVPTTVTPPLIQGGRILGFNQTSPAGLTIPAGAMTALTTTDQPLLIPILQLHSPQGAPDKDPTKAFPTKTINADYWVQRVPSNTPKKDTIYNAVFIMGDSPSRPPGESGGGLGNFPRFLEAWEDIVNSPSDNTTDDQKAITDIKGSFIQFKKSAYATAPFEAIDDPTKDNSLFFDTVGDRPVYMTAFNDADSGKPYIYKGGGQGRKAPYYRAPNRQWGYDIGLLSQTPDLFSRRFANPTLGTPNQYFRQVERNDKWITTLLCAAQKPTGAGATGYEWAIADPKQRPSSCPTLTDFNDSSTPPASGS